MGVERDGIGEYSRQLHASLSRMCRLEPFPLDREVHRRSHYREMAESVNRCDLLHLEHSSNFFKVPLFPFRDGYRDFLRRVRVPRVVVYHEPVDRVPIYPPHLADTRAERWVNAVKYAGKRMLRPVIDRYLIPQYNAEIFSLPERVVVHAGFHAELVRRFAPGANVTVSPLPVPDLAGPDGSAGGEPFLPFGEGDRVMTVLGFIESRKDYIGLLRALARLPERYKLLVAGGCQFAREAESPASTYGKMMRFMEENGLRGRVHVTGFFPGSAFPRIVAATNVFLVPFLIDHCSASITTGAASSLPVIAYRTLLTEEMNRNGAGLIEVSGWEEIPGVVLASEKDPSIYGESVRMGGRYKERCSYPATAARFGELYRELLQ